METDSLMLLNSGKVSVEAGFFMLLSLGKGSMEADFSMLHPAEKTHEGEYFVLGLADELMMLLKHLTPDDSIMCS